MKLTVGVIKPTTEDHGATRVRLNVVIQGILLKKIVSRDFNF